MPAGRIRQGISFLVPWNFQRLALASVSAWLMQAGGVEQAPLRKDISEVRRLATSLMPPFTEAISPEDMASLLAWLRSNLGPAEAKPNQKK